MPVKPIHVAQHLIMLEHPAVVAPVHRLLITQVHITTVAPTTHRLITEVVTTPVAQLKTLVLHQDIAALITALVVMVQTTAVLPPNVAPLVSTQVFLTLVATVLITVRHPQNVVLIFQLVALVLLTLVFHLQLVVLNSPRVNATVPILVVPVTPQALALTAHLAALPQTATTTTVVQWSLLDHQLLDHT